MAYSRIIHTKSEAVGAVPAEGSLSYGEIAINYSDGHLYIKKADNTVKKVASADFPGQIANLTNDVNSLNNTVNFLNLQFRQAEDLDFGRDNTNGVRTNNSLTYGLSNEIGTSSINSLTFGISNKVSGERGIAIGSNNEAAGNDSIAIGSYIKTPTNVTEFGKWTNNTTRLSSIRAANQNIAMTLANSATAVQDGGATVGEEASDKIPRDMYTIRRNGDEVLLDVNIGGSVKTCSFGDSTSLNNTSVGTAIQNDRADGADMVKSIRRMDQNTYDNLGSYDSTTIYIVT